MLLLTSVTSGVRRGEALGLLKENLHLDEGSVVIKHSLSFISGKGLVLGETKSEKSIRKIALPEFTINVLRDHLSKHSQNSRFVFSTGKGTPFSPRNILRHFKLKIKEAGLPMATRIHDLRHSYISWLIRAGQDIKSVQATAGHAQASTTLEIYGHLLPGYNREAADKIEGMFN
ncbi:MAG TPA: site-specific integrase [Anaerolineales bacterium]|nr:site-specific integrase [Anaerolineales bacterium]